MKQIKDFGRRFWSDEEGISTLEIILILAIVIVIAIAFRKWILAWAKELLESSNNEMNKSKSDSFIIPTP